jgi:hypothetical protein
MIPMSSGTGGRPFARLPTDADEGVLVRVFGRVDALDSEATRPNFALMVG